MRMHPKSSALVCDALVKRFWDAALRLYSEVAVCTLSDGILVTTKPQVRVLGGRAAHFRLVAVPAVVGI